MKGRVRVLALCVLLTGCRRTSADTCEPQLLLRQVGSSISEGNSETLVASVLTFRDIEVLRRGKTERSITAKKGREFDRALREELVRDVKAWKNAVGDRRFNEIQLGRHQRGSLSVMVDEVESLSSSILIFGEGESLLRIPVERLVNVNGCWKLAELGDPKRSGLRTQLDNPGVDSGACLADPDDLLRALAAALVASNSDFLFPWNVSDDDIKKLGGNEKDFEGFGESSQFFTQGDIESWGPLVEKASVAGVVRGKKEAIEWRGISKVETIDDSELLFSRDSVVIKVPVKRMINVGGCWKVDRVGTPPD